MKVDCIRNNKQINFTAGQVSLYSDFDGTYFPAKHSELHDISQERIGELNNYFNEFKPLLQDDDFHFTITSGRTLGEFQTVADLIKSKGIQMVMPDTFIAKNGSDEYIRTASDSEYYNQGKFPFNYGEINVQKREEIKQLTGWHDKIKDKFLEILKKHTFEIIECESENSGRDYGQGSLMTHVRYDDFELTSNNMQAGSEWKVGLRKDGKLKLYASFPYDMLNVGERSYVYDQIKGEFEKYLEESDIKFIRIEDRDKVGGNRPILVYTPKLADGNSLIKLYDTKEAVKKAIENNDFVITAGDDKNDFEMLNPLNYIETSDLEVDLQKQLKNISEENIEEILKNKTVIERLKKLPFVGIIIKGENNGLENIVRHFEQFNRIIEADSGNLQNAIKQAVQKYAEECPEFARSLKENLRTQLSITDKNTLQEIKDDVIEVVQHTGENTKKEASKGKGGKIAAIGTAIIAGISLILLYAKKNKKSKDSV